MTEGHILHPFGYDAETNSFVAFGNSTANCKLLVGYGFVGRDMVIGDDGRVSWEAASGRVFAGGEDGTYAIVSQFGETIRIETDHAGHMPVFYFQDGRLAAASNSIVRLVEHLRAVGVQLRPNPAELAARGTDFFPLHQLATFKTAVAGVSMLPAGCALQIEGPHCRVVWLTRRKPTSYPDDLKTFIATWVDRIATLLASGRYRLSVDLSGGLDSRMVFALFHMVMRGAPPEWIERISIYSHSFLSTLDPEIAEKVLQVSEKAMPHGKRWQRSFSALPSSGLKSLPMSNPFCVWWIKSGGIYSPNYLTSMQPDPGMIFFGGGGGEGFRNFYGKYFPTPTLFAGSCRLRIGLPSHADWLQEEIMSTFAALESNDDNVNPMILHYREFRGRLHGGLRSRNQISLMPIASGLLQTATQSILTEVMVQGQIFHDIIGNCAPQLVGVRFDQEKKSPTPEIRARFVNCGVDTIKIQPGIVHGPPVTTPSNTTVKVDGLRQLADAVESVGKLPYVREIWRAEAIQKAIEMTRQAALAGRFPHPNPASLVSGILLTGMFD